MPRCYRYDLEAEVWGSEPQLPSPTASRRVCRQGVGSTHEDRSSLDLVLDPERSRGVERMLRY